MSVAINKGIYIVAAKRTPFGRLGGLLRDVHPSDLVATAAKEAFKASGVSPALIDSVNVGQVYGLSGTSDGGLSPRHAALKAGVAQEKPALGVNRLCGSGFQAVVNSAQDIMTGAAQISLAGGTENMSAVPFVVRNTRFGTTLGNSIQFEDMLSAGSLDSYCNFTMPQTAENLAEKYELKRGEVDEFALQSQKRWKTAYDAGIFKEEMAPITVKVKKQEVVVDKDEHPRPETTSEALCKLPVLFRKGGVVTAGNSSGVNDGAGALILASEEAVQQNKLSPLARLVGWSYVGVDPSVMGIGPVPAIQNLLKVTNLTLNDIDLIEINEAFAAQTLACVRELNLDQAKLNVNGGAIALGHPVGASGARITAHLTHELRRYAFKIQLISNYSYSAICKYHKCSHKQLTSVVLRCWAMSLKCKGVFIIGAKRTPFCKFGGVLRDTPACDAFAVTAKDAIQTAKVDPNIINNTVVGNVHYLSQCDGGKTPRYCGIYSGVPIDRPALGVNKSCGSGLQALITGALDILTGVGKVSLTGGTEIMSALPFLVKNARFGTTLGKSYLLEDYIQKQFLDGYSGMTLEMMSEKLATKYGVYRKDVDEYAVQSHMKWKAAQESNVFDDEITKLTLNIKNKQTIVIKDELPQPDVEVSALATLPTTVDGASIVTAGNSSMHADGAAAVLISDEETVLQHYLNPLARIVAWARVGSDPLQLDLGAVLAVRKLLDITGFNVDDVDLFEINETFAAQAIVSARELKVGTEILNVSGGAIAVGNPVGATGARMVVHLVHQLRRRKNKRGIAASSCGGGQGLALLIETI
ncbi:unnamed protein product [Diatraea saccharalis]|uniref:Uncharacterized protein n=1 Tax=Diatraea saccharalis TaxID=40085 RepID=A0A9P0C725_9NEOP|nr:unnamed protein product [Diatraea saccharalis]